MCFSGNEAQPMQGNEVTGACQRRGAVQLRIPDAAGRSLAGRGTKVESGEVPVECIAAQQATRARRAICAHGAEESILTVKEAALVKILLEGGGGALGAQIFWGGLAERGSKGHKLISSIQMPEVLPPTISKCCGLVSSCVAYGHEHCD